MKKKLTEEQKDWIDTKLKNGKQTLTRYLNQTRRNCVKNLMLGSLRRWKNTSNHS